MTPSQTKYDRQLSKATMSTCELSSEFRIHLSVITFSGLFYCSAIQNFHDSPMAGTTQPRNHCLCNADFLFPNGTCLMDINAVIKHHPGFQTNCPQFFYCKVSNMHLKDSLEPHCNFKAMYCFLYCVCPNFNHTFV